MIGRISRPKRKIVAFRKTPDCLKPYPIWYGVHRFEGKCGASNDPGTERRSG
jgi:hypothetical protein